ncbi:DUF6115 domain-containing protein [Hydrogenimonas sp.]
MSELVWAVVGLAGALLIVVLYMAVKDRETSRKLAMMEAGIDGVNQEIFKIARELERLEKRLHEEMLRFELEQRQAHEPNDAWLQARLEPLMKEVASLKEEVARIGGDMRAKMESIDEKVRTVAFAVDHSAPDEQKILQLHAQGMDSETIAKQLRLGKGEVELVLKFAKIHA